MKLKWFLCFCVFAISAVSAFAQTKTVTNFELEKYRQQRIQAEKDLRENYEKLGFSSPEERGRRDEAKRIENAQLAERFERERIERESAEAAAQQVAAQQRYYQSVDPGYQVYSNGFIYSYQNRNRFRVFQPQLPSGYFAGGAFWPNPVGPRQPIFVVRPPVGPRR